MSKQPRHTLIVRPLHSKGSAARPPLLPLVETIDVAPGSDIELGWIVTTVPTPLTKRRAAIQLQHMWGENWWVYPCEPTRFPVYGLTIRFRESASEEDLNGLPLICTGRAPFTDREIHAIPTTPLIWMDDLLFTLNSQANIEAAWIDSISQYHRG